jgi:hypothetical protein
VAVFDFEPMPCHDHWDMHSCNGETNCKWANGANICVTEGETIPCDKFYSEEQCEMEAGCTYSAEATRCLGEDEVLTAGATFAP